MAKLTNILKSDITKGVAIGLGVAAAGLLLTPALRPVTRGAMKSGILLFEKGREWMAEASESLEDLVAEVRAELAEQRFADEAVFEEDGDIEDAMETAAATAEEAQG
ncbi:hypothetical protein SAMN02949497_0678 [Methylomagnum ishizawai]|uniref:DUF5132 domain-containing protein n=1 Tax=Methylomagnum ishizawai TaxID=1760988 RepID=A0A1Y6CSW8_9GAMM|nr:DUF5132 domain-containing protein [Methylomagnum ishizawai]SMF93397.1 hypothetical protein SAMN02949497_0678 [Methylomagnum ishizawai]